MSDLPAQQRNVRAGLLGTDRETATALAALGALIGGHSVRSAASSVTASDRGRLIEATNGSWTPSLPPAATAGAGFPFAIRNSGTGTITHDPDGTKRIDGAATAVPGARRRARVVCTGTAWASMALRGSSGGAVLAPAGTFYRLIKNPPCGSVSRKPTGSPRPWRTAA